MLSYTVKELSSSILPGCHTLFSKPFEPSLSISSPPPPPLPSPPSFPPLLEDLPSHSLTFSLRLIPLTMHVPKTDLIFINGANPAPPLPTPPPHAPGPSLSCIASFPNPSPVPVQARRLTSPLHHLKTPPWPPHPDDPHIDRHPTPPYPPILEFGGVCQRGVHQSVALS